MTVVQRKEADDMRHTAEMEMSRSQLQQLEGLSVFSPLTSTSSRLLQSCISPATS